MRIHTRRGVVAAILTAMFGASVGTPGAANGADPISVDWSVAGPVASGTATIQFVAASPSGVFVAGSVSGALEGQVSLGGTDGFVARYTTGGDLEWARHVGTSGSDHLTSLVVTGSGVYVGGRTSSRVEGGIEHVPEGFVARTSLAGQAGWIFAEPDPDFFPVRLAAASDGGVFAGMTGWEPSPGPGVVRPLFFRHFTAAGTISWEDQLDGWWTDDVETDAAGLTVSGQREGMNRGDAFVRRYSSTGSVLWTKVVEPAYNNDVRVHELASTGQAIWASGIGYVPTDGLAVPEKWFVRRLAGNGSTTWTKPIDANRIVADCSSFVAISGTVPADPNERPGAYLARFGEDGTETWRWSQDGNTDTRVNFVDVAIAGDVAYLIREEVTGGDAPVIRLQGLVNVPTEGGCSAPADTTPPTATAPSHRLVSGSAISGGRTTVRLGWTGSDAASGIDHYELMQSTDGGAWATVSTTLTSAGLDQPLAPNHTYRFRLVAVDGAGNPSAPVYGPTFRLTHYGETSSRITYGETWTTSKGAIYWGGQAKASSRAGARATLTVTGRSVEWVARKGPARGKAQVYVNGVLSATVDLYASTYHDQRVVWAANWSSPATRTISIRVLGTSGRPRVDLDAIVVGS